MSSSAPNLSCEVSRAPIACPRNPGMPEGALRFVKHRADLAASDPKGGFASAMHELTECAESDMTEDDTTSKTSTATSPGESTKHRSPTSPSPTKIPSSPTTSISTTRAEEPPVSLGTEDPDAARFVATMMAYAAFTAEETKSALRETKAGRSLREMRAGVEQSLMHVVNKQTAEDDAAAAAETVETVETTTSMGNQSEDTKHVPVVNQAVVEPETGDPEAYEYLDSAPRVEPENKNAPPATEDSNVPEPLSAPAPTKNKSRTRSSSGAGVACALVAAVAVVIAATIARRLRKQKEPDEGNEENENAKGSVLKQRFSTARGVVVRRAVRARQVCFQRVTMITGGVVTLAHKASRVRNLAQALPFVRVRVAAAATETAGDSVPEVAALLDTNSEELLTEHSEHRESEPVVTNDVGTVENEDTSPEETPASDSDPDEAIFEEATKIGRDLIRGLLPTPLMLHGKTKPRWAEGDMSPAVQVNGFRQETVSPGTPPNEMEDSHVESVPVDDPVADDELDSEND